MEPTRPNSDNNINKTESINNKEDLDDDEDFKPIPIKKKGHSTDLRGLANSNNKISEVKD